MLGPNSCEFRNLPMKFIVDRLSLSECRPRTFPASQLNIKREMMTLAVSEKLGTDVILSNNRESGLILNLSCVGRFLIFPLKNFPI